MKRRLDAVDGFKAHIHTVIDEHEESYDADNIRDFVDLCIQAKRTEEEGYLFSGTVLVLSKLKKITQPHRNRNAPF